ncbi:MAG: AAA family ATPase [Saprospiraceae bacterium]|nr:AAA family ATPase [Saprospiraceae bacterium]MBK7737715.1 AAA family ATPase [Saprospiraceae bacterium]MBK7913701.1 AAA family ATPase [Saprospiraceae bacterium]
MNPLESTLSGKNVQEPPKSKSLKSARIHAIHFAPEDKMLRFYLLENQQDEQLLTTEKLSDKTQKQLSQIFNYLQGPIDLYVHGFTQKDSVWEADAIVLLPDYLIDVTSVASCFNHQGSQVLKQLVSNFWYNPPGFSTLIGTSVNLFLDELILNPNLKLEDLIHQLFKHNPLAFSLFDDVQVEKFYDTVRQHFYNIKTLIDSRFNVEEIQLKDCLLEPSFYSVQYGIQGRLDVLYENSEKAFYWILELKSGKPYLPNKYGINTDHHAQIMLYYLLIQSVYGADSHIKCHVLYSSQTENSLRFAPTLEDIIHELIQIRNSIILMHLHLAFRKKQDAFIFDSLNDKHFSSSESYTKRDAGFLLNIYKSLNSFEKEYFKVFSGFIAREQFIAKLGRANIQYTEGLASLWLLSESEKIEFFMILPGLEISSMLTPRDDYPILILKFPQDVSILSNFRVGDTLVLYEQPDILQVQVYKCTLIEQFPSEYHIRLRTRQFPNLTIAQSKKWNLEHDSMDRNFTTQFQGLTEFCQSDETKRNLLLGLQEPGILNTGIPLIENTPLLIQSVLQKILKSKDYFLLWGPPGSGKTSMVIKYLTASLYLNSKESILLLAYTNRAVDEICEAIESINLSSDLDFIRIGSRYAVHPKFRKNLLEEKISGFKTRKELQKLINSTRIVTATLASIQGKRELFQLKNFDTVIIDEASQILESQLIGILPRFKRFILIGDHMQLPAVTAQTEEESKIQSDLLVQQGFKSLSTSYFERMLNTVQQKNWIHCYDMLHFQGRMHRHLMQFPSRFFYQEKLQTLPDEFGFRQLENYSEKFNKTKSISSWLCTERIVFIDCKNETDSMQAKINLPEAILVAQIVQSLFKMYQEQQINWTNLTLGVITPFRAQIALIKQQLQLLALDENLITVDTAERYQGGSRDIIILSTVISDPSQMIQISSVNADGVDRKLNVALTRARDQIILIGNEDILNTSSIYKNLIESYYKVKV